MQQPSESAMHKGVPRSHSDQGKMDAFYRPFTVSGKGHCAGGLGAWKFDQGAMTDRDNSRVNQTDHNILLSLVDWVEGGNPLSVIVGTGKD